MSHSCARHHLLQEKKNLEVKKIIIIHKIDDMKFEKYVVELESCNFKEEDIKPFNVLLKTLWSLIGLTALYRTHQPCQTVYAKCLKLLSRKDCEILVTENVAFALDLGMIETFRF